MENIYKLAKEMYDSFTGLSAFKSKLDYCIMMKVKILFLLPFILFITSNAFAEKELPVRCTGDNVTYVKEENTIYGKGNVEISYLNNYMRADNIKVNIKTKVAEAEGRVVASDGINVFTGDKIVYNFETGKGEVDGIGSRMGPWFGRGQNGEKISENLFFIKNGTVTTCDYEKPHYKIKAKDIYIYPSDKIIAKNIIVYWGDVPVFYWPYFKKSLKDNRSPWTFIPGYNSELGKYLITGYTFWLDNFLGGVFEPTLRLDWYEKRGLAAGLYGKYKYKNKIESLIRSYIINDRGYKEDGVKKEKLRGRFSMDYVQKITNDTRGIIDLNLLSDPNIIKDYFRKEFQEDIQTENYINISKTSAFYQLSLMIKKDLNNFYNDLERFPELTLNIVQRRVGETNLLYTGSASLGYLMQTFNKEDGGEDYSATRFDTTQQLSYPKKFFGWLNTVPRVGTRQTFWTKRAQTVTTNNTNTQTSPTPPGAIPGTTTTTSTNATGTSTTTTTTTTVVDPVNTTVTQQITTVAKKELDINTWRSLYFTGAEITTKIAKVFLVQSDFWDINQLRHVIEPRANYIYSTRPTMDNKDLLGFSDLASQSNYVELGIRNKLQTKRGNVAWNLVDWWISSNYFLQQFTPITGEEQRSFSHIYSKLELRPFDWIAADLDADYDQYDKEIDSFNTEMVLYRGDRFSFGLGYRYARDVDKLWTSEINYTINSDWAIRMQHRYEFDTGELQAQEYEVFRDFHCWTMAFTFRQYRDTGESEGFIVFYPKAFPNVPVTFGTTYFGKTDTNEVNFDVD